MKKTLSALAAAGALALAFLVGRRVGLRSA